MDWQQIILNWYKEHKRSLPWRKTNDPYKVWVSEIILQQTKVAYGAKYYDTFIKKFPTIHDLAKANQQTILNLSLAIEKRANFNKKIKVWWN